MDATHASSSGDMLMTDADPVSEAVIRALALPDTGTAHVRGPYGQLFGAAVSLLEAYRIALRHPEIAGQNTWNLEELLPDFESALKQGTSPWHHTPNLTVWTLGFHINNAQVRTANALDRSVNVWLTRSLGPRMPALPVAGFFHSLVRDRVALVQLEAGDGVRHQAAALVKSLVDHLDTEAASPFIQRLVSRWPSAWSPPQDALQRALVDRDPTGHDCLAVVFARVNAFKHLPGGTQDKRGHGLLAEWIITLRAFLWLSAFSRALQADPSSVAT